MKLLNETLDLLNKSNFLDVIETFYIFQKLSGRYTGMTSMSYGVILIDYLPGYLKQSLEKYLEKNIKIKFEFDMTHIFRRDVDKSKFNFFLRKNIQFNADIGLRNYLCKDTWVVNTYESSFDNITICSKKSTSKKMKKLFAQHLEIEYL